MASSFSADKRDFALREIGCICCRMRGVNDQPGEKHHLLTTGLHGNGKRLGEKFTLCLCKHHHTGVDLGDVFISDIIGVSYGKQPKQFRKEFGSDKELLSYQNQLLCEYADNTIGISYETLGCEQEAA